MESPKTLSFLTPSSRAASSLLMQASYSASLLVHWKSNLTEKGMYSPQGVLNTTPIPFPWWFHHQNTSPRYYSQCPVFLHREIPDPGLHPRRVALPIDRLLLHPLQPFSVRTLGRRLPKWTPIGPFCYPEPASP